MSDYWKSVLSVAAVLVAVTLLSRRGQRQPQTAAECRHFVENYMAKWYPDSELQFGAHKDVIVLAYTRDSGWGYRVVDCSRPGGAFGPFSHIYAGNPLASADAALRAGADTIDAA